MARKAGRKRLLFFLYFLVFGGVAANVLRGALQAGTTGGSILGIGRIGVDKANPAYIREAQRLFLDYSQPIGQYSLAQNLGYVYSFAVTRGFGSVRYVTNDLPVGWNQMTVTAREFTSAYLDVGIRDRERTREWYQSVFDAEVKPHPRMLQLYLDDSEIHFPETPNPAYLKSNHFAVEVADWEGMMAHVAALDIPFDDGLGP